LTYNRRRKRRTRSAFDDEFIKESLLSPELKAFALGLGVGVLTMALFPQVRDKVIPATENAAQGVKELLNRLTGITQNLKEGLEDLVAEAKFEELKQAIDNDIAANGHDTE